MFDFSISTGAEKIENGDLVCIKPNKANKLAMDSLTLQDPHGSNDAGSNPANVLSNECSDTSQDLNNQVLIGSTVCSKSHSEERLSDSDSDDCASPSSTSHGVLKKKNKLAITSPVNDKSHPSPKCQLISPNDFSMTSLPLDAPDCHEIPALDPKTVASDPGTAKNLVDTVSDRNCHAVTDMNCDSPKLNRNPVLDSQVANNDFALKEVDLSDACDEVLGAGPSMNLSQENIAKENKENVDVPGSALNHAGESSLLVRSDLKDEIACERERNLHLEREVASNEVPFDKTGLNASSDGSDTDPA